MEPHAPVVYKKRSFLSTLALGASALCITGMLSLAVVVLYGMNIADRKSDNLLEAVEQAVRGLPELRKALPPVFADLLDDRRQLDYAKQVEVSARLAPAMDPDRGLKAVVEVRNKGNETISLFSMRLVVLDEENAPLAEWNVWPATPFAADKEWRGPLLPGSTRHFATHCEMGGGAGRRGLEQRLDAEMLRVEVEITDLRLWTASGGPARAERQV